MKTMRWFILVATIAVATCTWAAPVDRIKMPVNDQVRGILQGSVPPVSANAVDLGAVESSMPLSRMTLFFNRSEAQQADLDSLLEQQQDPSSPNYHKWLTPEQFGQRFGVSDADIAKAAQWLQGHGFRVLELSPSRNYIAFSGTAAQAQAAFGTEIHDYMLMNGERHYANVAEPSLPQALAEVTQSVGGLHNFGPKPRSTVVRPRFTSSISGNHFLVPDDVATIYHLKPLYDQGIDGTGQSIGVMGQTAIDVNFVATFRSLSGLPANNPQVFVVPVPPGNPSFVSNNDLGEAYLDVEWPGAVARNASIIYVNSGTSGGVFDAMKYAITHQIFGQTIPVLSISYGNCEANWSQSDINNLTAAFQQANTQGQTVIAPSGDQGAGDCESSNATTAIHGLAVDFPASSQFVTGVGGTMFFEAFDNGTYWSTVNNSFNGSALSHIPEIVWNETRQNPSGCTFGTNCVIAASGGGKSTMTVCDTNGQNCHPNTKPGWQVQLTPADSVRDVPDVSLPAAFIHDPFLICASGQTPADCTNGYRDTNSNLDAIGGTSGGVPVFAGMVALLNQAMQVQAKPSPVGNVNPALYTLAGATPSPDAFHDIGQTDNMVPCKAGALDCANTVSFGYGAFAGWDYPTGLGSLDAYNLITELSTGTVGPTPVPPDFSVSPAGPPSLTVTHGTSSTYTITVTPGVGFTGTVTFSCAIPAELVGLTCTPPPQMTAPYGPATFTITASPTAQLARPGASPTFLAWNWGGGTLIAGLLLGAGERKKKNHNLRAMLLGGALLVLLLVALVGCGGGSSSATPAPTPTPTPIPVATSGTIALQGTSGASGTNVHWVAVAVNIN